MARNTKKSRLNIAKICTQIESGISQREIAEGYDIAPSALSAFLNLPENSERFARARESSAEAWLDRGLKAVEDAPPSKEEIARARAIAHECARRAAIRNPKYRDKPDAEVNVTVNTLTEEQVDARIRNLLPDAGR